MSGEPPDPVEAASAAAMTALILQVFRANGALLAAGDRLVGTVGLTSARWQLLGGFVAQPVPLPVAGLARHIGVTRQAVQRIANELAAEGIVAFRDNPGHKRAQLVELTPRGRALLDRAMALQRPWAARIAAALSDAEIADGRRALDRMLAALDGGGAAAPA